MAGFERDGFEALMRGSSSGMSVEEIDEYRKATPTPGAGAANSN